MAEGGIVGDNPAGLVPDDQGAIQEAQYGGVGNTILSAGEGLANTVTGGLYSHLAKKADTALGLDPEFHEKVKEQNPTAYNVGQVGGLLSGEGAVALAGKAAKVGEAVVGGGLPVKLGLENALFSLGDEVAKQASNNPDSIQTAAMHVGLSGLLGGVAGYPLGQVSKAWTESVGPEIESLVKDFTDGLKDRAEDIAPRLKVIKGPIPNFPPSPGTPLLEEVPLEITSPSLGAIPPSKGSKAADFLLKKVNNAATEAAADGLGAALGHLSGIPGGGAIGAMMGHSMLKPVVSTVLPSIIGPLLKTVSSAEGLKAASDTITAIMKGDALANSAIKGLFEVGSNKTIDNLAPDKDKLAKLDERISSLKSDPQGMFELGGSMGHYLPAHQTALAAASQNAIDYIDSLKPRPKQPGILDRSIEPSPQEKASYTRTLAIAEQPLMVLSHLKNGSLQPKDVQDLQAMYPSVYSSLTKKINEALITHLSKDGSISFKHRAGLSTLLGQPMDSSFSQQARLAAQMTFMPSNPPPDASKTGKAASSPKKSTSKLGKSAELASTPQESRIRALSKP